MSGILALLQLDRAPVDTLLLERLTRGLEFRGPDRLDVWSSGSAGLGHALLTTTAFAQREQQPCSLDGHVWITADVRLDARADLLRELTGAGCDVAANATDPELLLHAYAAWGTNCVRHLLGDFSFVVWDRRRELLFCARDHFGLKPCYYARVGDNLAISNTLNCLRLHPAISDRLNEQSIADFLLFDDRTDPSRTAFADIQRLPAGHLLTWTGNRLRIERYWELPIEEPLRYRRAADYVEEFRALLQTSIRDRLTLPRIAMTMSGGVDSTTVAAMASDLRTREGLPVDLRSFTMVYDRLLPDRERYYSTLAAQALGLPITHLPLDDCRLFQDWDDPHWQAPEPMNFSATANDLQLMSGISRHSRVVLGGYCGDDVYQSTQVWDLLGRQSWLSLAGDIVRCVGRHRRLPPLGFRNPVLRVLGMYRPVQPDFPGWLNPDFAARNDLADRWALYCDRPRSQTHPSRPLAYDRLTRVLHDSRFDEWDAGVSGFPVEMRAPLLDLRVIRFLLRVPPLPWFVNKELPRQATRGLLPDEVRLRRKTALAGFAEVKLSHSPELAWADQFEPEPELEAFVNRAAIAPLKGEADPHRLWMNLHPVNLNLWLQRLKKMSRSVNKELYCELTA